MSETTLQTLAVVFPGQGSQSVGMLSDMARQYPVVQETFSEASEIVGYDLWNRVLNGPAELLNQTACTQPAMLAAGVALWRCWTEVTGLRPAWLAGHSLGEYTALVCAGVMHFADAVKAVEQRGHAMQNAVPEGVGAMAAILGLDDEVVVSVCAQAAEGETVSAVNFNAPGQIVIAGHNGAVERAMALAKQAGARRAIKLPVSVPSHSALMRSAGQHFEKVLDSVAMIEPEIPVLHNVDVKRHESVAEIRKALTEQLYSPVRWVETVRALYDSGVTTVVELGPGKVLTGLNKRIEKQMTAIAVEDPAGLQKALDALS
jgi:[acyl-carrier-protein] S-malonyltransferase